MGRKTQKSPIPMRKKTPQPSPQPERKAKTYKAPYSEPEITNDLIVLDSPEEPPPVSRITQQPGIIRSYLFFSVTAGG